MRFWLTDMGVIQIAGHDARAFLQGQLSNDMLRLTPEQSLLTTPRRAASLPSCVSCSTQMESSPSCR
jgi:hypothetical protein